MSKDNVIQFIRHTEKLNPSDNLAMKDMDPKTLVLHADNLGFSFTEEDLKAKKDDDVEMVLRGGGGGDEDGDVVIEKVDTV